MTNRPLLIIIAIAVALRLIGVWMAGDLEPKRDERQYLAAARSIAATGYPVYPNPHWDEAHAAPGYPYLLAACYQLVGKASFQLTSQLVQVALSVLTVFLVYWIARRVFDPQTALVAAAATGVFPTLIAYSHYFYTETLYTFLLLCTTAILIKARESATAPVMLLAGVVGGLTALSRSAFVLSVPFILLWIGWSFRADRARSLLLLAAFAGGMVLSVGPWSVRSTLRYDRFLLIDTNGGNVLQKNWNSLPRENYDIGLLKPGKRPLVDRTHRIRHRPRVREANIVDRNNAEIRAAIGFGLQHPGAVLRRSGIRAVELVNPTSFLVLRLRTDKYSKLAGWGRETIVVAVVLSTMAVLLMAVLGIAARPVNSDQLLLLLLLGSHTLSAVAIISMSRYRFPMMPLLILYAAHAAVHFRSHLDIRRNRSRWVALAIVAPFLIGSWILYVPYSFP